MQQQIFIGFLIARGTKTPNVNAGFLGCGALWT
jgi:hypothetical protein